MLRQAIKVVVEIRPETPAINFSVFVNDVEMAAEQVTNGDLFHERVEGALGNLLRPITNSAAAELRKLRRKAQANQ